jgi:CubicO group peptidase (beta-lactamase class C family)
MPTIPRLPFVGDPLRRIRVPRDLEAVTTVGEEDGPEAGGVERANVDAIWKSAVGLYRSGVHPAVQVCVRRHGAVVLDRAIGHARGNGPKDPEDADKVPATPATPFLIYSGSKAITAFVIHLLAERGLVRLDAPVAEYIPGNRELLMKVLCDAKPFARAGRFLAYHAVSGGFILGEVAERVSGRPIRELLADEILDPLGFEWTNYGVAPERVDEVALNYVTGPAAGPPLSTLLTRALGLPLDQLVAASNDPRFLTGVVPAASTITTANELSRFFELMRRGGELDGVRVLERETIRRALTEQSHLEFDLSLGFPTRFSYGLMLGAQVLSLYGRDTQHAFGHLGFTNILGWADAERATAVAVITNGKPTLYPELPRFFGLTQKITSEMPKQRPAKFAF